jgi:recombination protein RecA
VQKSGSWFSFGEERIGQGRDNAREFLQKNPAIAKSVDEKLRKVIFPEREIAGSKPLGANARTETKETPKPKADVTPVRPATAEAEGGSDLF